MNEYPPVGFHFLVTFQMVQSPVAITPGSNPAEPDLARESRFQEVSGLESEMEMESFVEGGQNRFTWQLPKRTRYNELTMKRGMMMGSGIVLWCRNAFENFLFDPVNLNITLLNEQHIPLHAWYVVNAIPKKWSVSGFNAMENSIVIESLTLSYQFFNVVRI